MALRDLANLEHGADIDHLNRPGSIGCDYLVCGAR